MYKKTKYFEKNGIKDGKKCQKVENVSLMGKDEKL